ncbi:MAG: hypothetical protein JWN70_4436 [Planctomycetaceae bacterium]|nr:hypothetical protein [Planctomycetaceae bacterium]
MKSICCTGPLPRRDFLQAGALALGGITLPQVLAGRAAAGTPHVNTSVIMLYLHGGPSQLETYDLKPDAPSEYRSLFQPIPTNVPGMDICELFPLQAKLADKFSLVRSLHHDIGIHSDGGIIVLTGKRPSKLDPTSGSKSEHPDFGSVASKMRGYGQSAMPPYVAIPHKPYMTLPAYLGLSHTAFEAGDPAAAKYQLPHLKLAAGVNGQGLANRRQLLQQFDRFRAVADQRGSLTAMDDFQSVAFRMLISPEIADAFDLSREDAALRDRYGRHQWGQGCLMARRLAEAGTAVVNLYINTPQSGPDYTNWDDHIGNAGRPGHFAGYMKTRLPYLDQALSALIEDLFARALDRRILVVVVGEFGRTPRISHNTEGTGRDHWPQAYTALFSGGGLKMGQVVGATNSKAEYPSVSPYTPFDMLATIYRHLGIDYKASFLDFAGRPIPILNDGELIRELV